ncbi:hypothetical protein ABH935_005411 [Catenulispora sp. GAS73]|uniref:hypothetical protein n=1 Tax=Catenulispora sp. GAS73 TaxID=3156269 RepID=UPI003516FD5D
MDEVSVRPAHAAAAVADALRTAGFSDAAPEPSTGVVVLTAASACAAVLVRIVPQRVSRHAFVTLICATCRRHQRCGWRAQLGADVPASVVATCAHAALSAPMPCENTPPAV